MLPLKCRMLEVSGKDGFGPILPGRSQERQDFEQHSSQGDKRAFSFSGVDHPTRG